METQKILVIEDEAELRESVVEALQFEGFNVLEAPDGRVGLQLARELLPDLVISDIAMPEVNGYEVLVELRQEPSTAKIPFIFMTARADRSFVRHGMELGADDYITKPCSNVELVAAVHARLERHSQISQASAEKISQATKQLVRLVTHELRTPLSAISMAQDIIGRQINQISSESLEELLGVQRSGSDRLTHLVEQMVLLTRLEAGELTSESISEDDTTSQLWTILMGAVDLGRRFAYRKPKTDIHLDERDKDTFVVCDVHALKHAFAELISNALDYSSEGRQVAVSQWRAKDHAYVSIVDQGIGMSQEQQDIALRSFQQVDREQNEQQGMGLGLPLAERIIRTHSGELTLVSVVGKGTQITIKLPLS